MRLCSFLYALEQKSEFFFFPVKGQIVNILGFAGHTVSVQTQLCHCFMKADIDCCICASKKIYLQKQVVGWIILKVIICQQKLCRYLFFGWLVAYFLYFIFEFCFCFLSFFFLCYYRASLVAQMVKNLPAMQETWVQSLGWEDPPGKGDATHSSILARRIPWTI